jgi:protein O-GlcNAc transferase
MNDDLDKQLQQSLAQQQAGQYRAAEAGYRRILQQNPEHSDALHLLATLALQTKQPSDALPLLQRAIRLNPRDPAYYLNLGLAQKALGRLREALDAMSRAIELKPGFAEAHYQRGVLLATQHQYDEAARALRRALAIRRDYPAAQARLGNVLAAQGQLDKAVAALRRAIELQPDNPVFHVDLGNLHVARGGRKEAAACYDRALALAPDNRPALDNRIENRIKLCEWRDIGRIRTDYLDPALATAETSAAPARPMLVTQLPIPVSEREQLSIARAMTRVRTGRLTALRERLGFRYPVREGRLRVAYLSSEFRNHATAHLIQDLFGLHDRDGFEVFAYSTGPDDGSSYRRRIQSDSDRFHDLHHADPVELARRIHADGIDILVDLHGHSGNSRLEALALRPAPIQAGYLGYPGTTGAEFIDYLIADRIVVPPESVEFYDERLAWLPGCYQINSARPRTGQQHGRIEQGLPERGFVFCCFNGAHKIDPTLFGIWMRLLGQVPDSILWLLDSGADTAANLRREASEHGIDPQRLVFAPRIAPAEHLVRLALADLFLDTRFYNAHTTGSDALWAGVPVLTCPGETFAARVGKSLVSAAGLPELAVDTLEAYEATALRLAQQPNELAALKARLAVNRDTCPLFDTKRLVRNLERAYREMWAIHRAGEAPRPIQVREE